MIKPLNSWFNRFLMKEKSKVKKIYWLKTSNFSSNKKSTDFVR